MGKYIVHKAVNADAVVKKRQRSSEYMAEHYIAQKKYDGCCAVVTPHGSLSRTGELVQSLGQIERELAAFREFDNLVLIGEAFNSQLPQNVISGEFRRFAESDNLVLMVFDILTAEEFAAGHSDVPYVARMERVGAHLWARLHRSYVVHSWAPGTYGDPQALCDTLCDDPAGYDGLILRDPLGTWTAGSGTAGECVKIKRVLSFDLTCTGWDGGKGKHAGRMGAIQVVFQGKLLSVGTGFTDAEREDPAQFVGRIVEIEAMDYSADGLLREPRFKGIRHDKLQPDT